MKQVHANTGLSTETIARHLGVPGEVKRPFIRSIGHAKSMEQMLWREVAARMTLDALGITPDAVRIFDGMARSDYKVYARAVTEARVWFRKRKDPELVFEMAGVDIGPVQEAVLKLAPLVEPRNLRADNVRVRRAA